METIDLETIIKQLLNRIESLEHYVRELQLERERLYLKCNELKEGE
jgi:hypothetical protein